MLEPLDHKLETLGVLSQEVEIQVQVTTEFHLILVIMNPKMLENLEHPLDKEEVLLNHSDLKNQGNLDQEDHLFVLNNQVDQKNQQKLKKLKKQNNLNHRKKLQKKKLKYKKNHYLKKKQNKKNRSRKIKHLKMKCIMNDNFLNLR